MRHFLVGLLAFLLTASPAAAEIKWDTAYTSYNFSALNHTAAWNSSGWSALSTDTSVPGLHCAEFRVTSKSSSVIVGLTNDSTFIANGAFNHFLGNTPESAGQQDIGAYYVAGPAGTSSPNSLSFSTGYIYVCMNTVAQKFWVSKDLVTYYGNGSTGNGITAATVASTTSTGINFSITTNSPAYFAAACDAACSITFNGGYQAFNATPSLPSGYSTAEALVATGSSVIWWQLWNDGP